MPMNPMGSTGDESRRRRYRVSGDSMFPALRDGDEVDVDLAAFRSREPRPGEIVLARHPFKRETVIVKRVARIESDGRVFLVGDDPLGSSDSHGFGAVAPDAIVGLVELPRS